ncbi:MAG: T9SS type A sorting domain-containing protein, partial [Candidatus Zixiibacteriota bacterium]
TGEIYSPDTSVLYGGIPLQEGVYYYLRIRVNDGVSWCDWWVTSFRLNTPSSIPELIYPIGGEAVNVNGVRLSLNNSTDNEGDTRTYDFEIYSDPGLTTLFDSDIGVSEQESTTFSKFFTGFTLGAQYWWRARSYDGYEYSNWTAPDYFVTEQGLSLYVPTNYPTIQSAIAAASDGDNIVVLPGTYVENISFDGKAVVVISSDGPEVTTIQGAAYASSVDVPSEVDSSGTSSTDPGTDALLATVSFVSGEPKGAVLSGFTVTGGMQSGIYCVNSSPTIVNNVITGNASGGENFGGGLSLRGTAGAVVRGNTFYGNLATYGAAIHLGEHGYTNTDDTICYNVMYENSGIGEIRALGGLVNPVVHNNTAISTTWSGFLNQSSGPVIAKNNIIVFGDPYGMQGDFTATYNCTFECVSDYNFPPGVGNISEDPMFVDSVNNDYHLDAESPCVDAGDPDPFYNDPDGTRNDMGAYYYSSGAIVGSVTANEVGLMGVKIDLYDQASQMISSTVTSEDGFYAFSGLESDTYVVSVLSPLGFFTDQETRIVELTGPIYEVNFEMTASETEESQRTRGFWAHQVSVAMSEVDGSQIYRDELCEYLEKVRVHFNENLAYPITAYQVTSEANCTERLQELYLTIAPQVSEGFTDAATAQFTALLLNIASDKLGQWTNVSEDNASVSQAVTYCDLLLTDEEPVNDTLAQIIAETINKGQIVAAGVIDLATPQIMYKELESNGLPKEFTLSQNYPNPFNPGTQISFALPEAARVRIDVFNILGQRVVRLVDRELEAGYHSVSFDGSRFASGIYLYRIEAGDFVANKKMLLVK